MPGSLGGLARCQHCDAEIHVRVCLEQDTAADLRLLLAKWDPPVQGGVKGELPDAMQTPCSSNPSSYHMLSNIRTTPAHLLWQSFTRYLRGSGILDLPRRTQIRD